MALLARIFPGNSCRLGRWDAFVAACAGLNRPATRWLDHWGKSLADAARFVRLCSLAPGLLLLGAAFASAAPAKEYQVKAVFLFNFTHFVDWPPEAFSNADAPIVIGILGDDPFDGLLDEVVRGERVRGRSLVVQRYRRLQDVGPCHVLFISPVEAGRMAEILASLRGRSLLTVGESKGFAQAGGVIGFLADKGRIRLGINVEAAHEANLKLSSKLLRPAEIVNPGKD